MNATADDKAVALEAARRFFGDDAPPGATIEIAADVLNDQDDAIIAAYARVEGYPVDAIRAGLRAIISGGA